MSNEKNQEKFIRELAAAIEDSLRSGNNPTQIVDELSSQGMDREIAKKLVGQVKKHIFLSNRRALIPAPVIIGVREMLMFIGFGVAGLVVSIIASLILSIIGTIFSQIPGIGEPVAILMKLGEKIVGGILGMGFAFVASRMGTIAGAIGGFAGSIFAVYLIVVVTYGKP
jgi:hypothetical protein